MQWIINELIQVWLHCIISVNNGVIALNAHSLVTFNLFSNENRIIASKCVMNTNQITQIPSKNNFPWNVLVFVTVPKLSYFWIIFDGTQPTNLVQKKKFLRNKWCVLLSHEIEMCTYIRSLSQNQIVKQSMKQICTSITSMNESWLHLPK